MTFSVLAIALLEQQPVFYLLAAAGIVAIQLVLKIVSIRFENRKRSLRFRRFRNDLRNLLEEAVQNIVIATSNALSAEAIEIGVMLQDSGREKLWICAIPHNMKDSREKAQFSDDETSWLTPMKDETHPSNYLFDVNSTTVSLILDKHRNVDPKSFQEVEAIGVARIVSPDTIPELLGVVVSYLLADIGKQHQDRILSELVRIAKLVTPFLLYDDIVLFPESPVH